MKFGTPVLVIRGGGNPPGTPGSKRAVRGVLVGAQGHERYVRLTEDDPLDTIGWNKAGQVGHWGSSVVVPFPGDREAIGELLGRKPTSDEAWAFKAVYGAWEGTESHDP